MAPTNDFVPFCPTNTGSNLLSQGDYLASPNLPIGNQPGVASSKLINKVLRQASYMASCVAQYVANKSGDSILDDENQANVLASMDKAFRKAPTRQALSAPTGTYTTPAGVLYLRVRLVGGGGGGGGSGTANGTIGGSGGPTSFGSSLVTALGGAGATITPGAGGGAIINGPAIGLLGMGGSSGAAGGTSNGAGVATGPEGGSGGAGPFGAQPGGPGQGSGSVSGPAGSGSGGSGGAINSPINGAFGGGGGGAGGYVEAQINSPSATYAYAVGAGGAAGGAGASGNGGGAGGSGQIIIEEFYQ